VSKSCPLVWRETASDDPDLGRRAHCPSDDCDDRSDHARAAAGPGTRPPTWYRCSCRPSSDDRWRNFEISAVRLSKCARQPASDCGSDELALKARKPAFAKKGAGSAFGAGLALANAAAQAQARLNFERR
jgi:hypothetical protein